MVTSLGERLRLARLRKEMRQGDVGDALGLSSGHALVSQWERDKAIPTGEHLLALPGILGVNGHWLLTGDGPVEAPGTVTDDALSRAVERVDDALRQLRALGQLPSQSKGTGSQGRDNLDG